MKLNSFGFHAIDTPIAYIEFQNRICVFQIELFFYAHIIITNIEDLVTHKIKIFEKMKKISENYYNKV